MEKVFDEVGTLDRRCCEKYSLNEDILMENAAHTMATFIKKKFPTNSKILIVSGSGNNGADGIALARILDGDYEVDLLLPIGIKSSMGIIQLNRAKNIGLATIDQLSKNYDVVVEALFGSGLNRTIDRSLEKLLIEINELKAFKIACDFPTKPFMADVTITMGALKKGLFLDFMKDFVGDIIVGDLGLSRKNYETDTNCYLLEQKDMLLPFRKSLTSHKGNFGHLAVVVGEKKGAGLIACEAGFVFGAGLVSAITSDTNLPLHIMQNTQLPYNTTAIAIGMGLGKDFDKTLIENKIPKIIDADLFYDEIILKILKQENIVITPHPKEFCSLYKLCGFETITIEELQKNRFFYVERFSKKYPKIVLLLKGANTLIAFDETIYINSYGTATLSFGGSGDVLSGLIGSLLAQKYTPLESAITAILAHSFSARIYGGNDYSMKPQDLIDGIKRLQKAK